MLRVIAGNAGTGKLKISGKPPAVFLPQGQWIASSQIEHFSIVDSQTTRGDGVQVTQKYGQGTYVSANLPANDRTKVVADLRFSNGVRVMVEGPSNEMRPLQVAAYNAHSGVPANAKAAKTAPISGRYVPTWVWIIGVILAIAVLGNMTHKEPSSTTVEQSAP